MKRFSVFLYFVGSLVLTHAYHYIIEFMKLSNTYSEIRSAIIGLLIGIAVAIIFFAGIHPHIKK